jgi:hypothetical protein
MPYARVTYAGNGSTRTFTVPFPYISDSHVTVRVNGAVQTGVTWDNASTVRLTSAPPVGATVLVQRTTPKDAPLVDFTDGSLLTEAALDLASAQALYSIQEALDGIEQIGTGGGGGGPSRPTFDSTYLTMDNG